MLRCLAQDWDICSTLIYFPTKASLSSQSVTAFKGNRAFEYTSILGEFFVRCKFAMTL